MGKKTNRDDNYLDNLIKNYPSDIITKTTSNSSMGEGNQINNYINVNKYNNISINVNSNKQVSKILSDTAKGRDIAEVKIKHFKEGGNKIEKEKGDREKEKLKDKIKLVEKPLKPSHEKMDIDSIDNEPVKKQENPFNAMSNYNNPKTTAVLDKDEHITNVSNIPLAKKEADLPIRKAPVVSQMKKKESESKPLLSNSTFISIKDTQREHIKESQSKETNHRETQPKENQAKYTPKDNQAKHTYNTLSNQQPTPSPPKLIQSQSKQIEQPKKKSPVFAYNLNTRDDFDEIINSNRVYEEDRKLEETKKELQSPSKKDKDQACKEKKKFIDTDDSIWSSSSGNSDGE